MPAGIEEEDIVERIALCSLADVAVGVRRGPLTKIEEQLLATPIIGAAVATVGTVAGEVGIGIGVGANYVKGDEEEPATPPSEPAAPGSSADALLTTLRAR